MRRAAAVEQLAERIAMLGAPRRVDHRGYRYYVASDDVDRPERGAAPRIT